VDSVSRTPIALTIAGSDSGGGAGIQADLKTFSALGAYGESVLTAITAQNTLGVSAVFELPPDIVVAQIDAIMADIPPDVVKTGMIASTGIIQAVAERLRRHKLAQLVVDPVMVAKGGEALLQPDAVAVLRDQLLPLALIATPNLPEAESLLGRRIESVDAMRAAARQLVAEFAARAVVVKGGHLDGPPVDVFFDGLDVQELVAERVDTRNTHGTGCTLASAIAAYVAHGERLPAAVRLAKAYLTEALRQAYRMGGGHGPVHHFWQWWQPGDRGHREKSQIAQTVEPSVVKKL
jgi:hydroxymethylpyrimidine/phosphomethylpyrimidine kinase